MGGLAAQLGLVLVDHFLLGRPVATLLATKIAPYIDTRLNLLATWSLLAQLVTLETPTAPLWEPQRIKHCLVELNDKTQKDYALFWQNSAEGVNQAFVSQPKQEIKNLGKGIYWIHASNFLPNQAESIELEAMLEQLRTLGQAKTVILDTRGNGGGDSVTGYKILRALLKDKTPMGSEAPAFWRVSAIAKSSLEKYIAIFEQTLGKESDSYIFLVNFLEKMNHAIAAGQLWLEQPHFEVHQPEQGVGFKGRLLLITDSHCASACLDFVDVVKRIPGVLHLGLPTSADTQYNNVAEVELPSKNFELRLPLKVFRNRARGNNQPYYPDFLYEGDIRDTQAVQAWVMKKL